MRTFMLDFTLESSLPIFYRFLQNRYVLRVVTFLLLGILFGVLLETYIRFFDVNHPSFHQPFSVKQANALPNMQTWQLFGSYQMPLSALPSSQAPLKLIGVSSAQPADQSQAIIAGIDGTESVYQIGQTLPTGAILKQVLEDSVVIEQNGHQERLSMPKSELDFRPLPAGI